MFCKRHHADHVIEIYLADLLFYRSFIKAFYVLLLDVVNPPCFG